MRVIGITMRSRDENNTLHAKKRNPSYRKHRVGQLRTCHPSRRVHSKLLESHTTAVLQQDTQARYASDEDYVEKRKFKNKKQAGKTTLLRR